MNAAYLSDKFAAGSHYQQYVNQGTAPQQQRWSQVYSAAATTAAQRNLLGSFTRDMKLLAISGIWCGDCVQQVPLIARIAEANSARIEMRILERDQHRDLAEAVRLNAGDRVPVVLLTSEDFEFCSLVGDRTISRYRAMARAQFGPACPTGIVPPDQDEMAATLADWVVEIERVQLMLRLSPRLRRKHGD